MTNRSDETTADKAARRGMTPDEYRAHRHLAAVRQIRAALPGLYATTGLRVEAALTEPAAVSAVVEPPVDQTTPSHRAALRDGIRRVLCERDGQAALWGTDMLEPDEYGADADAVLVVLYREWPWLRAEAEDAAPPADRATVLRDAADAIDNSERLRDFTDDHMSDINEAANELRRMADESPLSPYYEHPECGFHWHGRDGMDIPMQDGQPVCPRCELAKVQKQLRYTQKMREEVGAESRRRGKIKLEQAEKIIALEKQLDEVRRQLGAEILRADQADAELRRMADETATETQPPHRPVALATPCTVCGHTYNWHTRRHGQCEVVPLGVGRCGCTGFVPGERPEPVDPRRILGADPDFAAAERQDGGRP